MTTRREKSKPQMNKQLGAANAKSEPRMENTWIENLGKYLLDISKFVTTGVVIASLFKDMDDSATIYVVGTIVAVSTLIVGLVLTNKKRKKEEYSNGNVSYLLCLWYTMHIVPAVLLDTQWQAVVASA